MQRVLLLVPSGTYRAADFLDAAAALGAEVVVACDERQTLAPVMGDRALQVDMADAEAAAAAIAALAARSPLDAIVALDDQGVVAAALAAARLGLPHSPPEAVAATRDKHMLRRALAGVPGVPQPAFALVAPSQDAGEAARRIGFPCVLKPLHLSASRGVVRADDPASARAAAEIARRAARSGAGCAPEADAHVLVEAFIPGAEVALEGMLSAGELEVLALFDKPDPLEGPYFEETIYVAPSRAGEESVREAAAVAKRACEALGLREGPVHAELRLSGGKAWLVEVAARTIGGLCSRSLSFGAGRSLEELVLAHALGRPVEARRREEAASGVMMLPVPAGGGALLEVRGREQALAVPHVTGLEISVAPGRMLRPWPDGDRYLGFLFAKAPRPEQVEAALREASSKLDVRMGAPLQEA